MEGGIQGGSGTKSKTTTKILATREVNVWKRLDVWLKIGAHLDQSSSLSLSEGGQNSLMEFSRKKVLVFYGGVSGGVS